jgi:hypothetical protein
MMALGVWLLFVLVFALGYCFGRIDAHLDSALANIRDLQSATDTRLASLDRISAALAAIRATIPDMRKGRRE